MGSAPSVREHYRVEWPDTDASGHYHHSTVIRWVEAAEAALLRELGLAHLMFGRTPRVHYEVDYLGRLWFGERATVELAVAEVGTSSVRLDFTVHRDGDGDATGGSGEVAARGRLVTVNASPDSPGAVPWPPEVRAVLTGDGAAG